MVLINPGFMNNAPLSEISQHKVIMLTNRKKFGLIASFLKHILSHLHHYHLNSIHLFRVLEWLLCTGCCEWRRGCLFGWISQMFAYLVTKTSQCYWFWWWLACCIFRKIQYKNWFMVNDRVCRLDHLNCQIHRT